MTDISGLDDMQTDFVFDGLHACWRCNFIPEKGSRVYEIYDGGYGADQVCIRCAKAARLPQTPMQDGE